MKKITLLLTLLVGMNVPAIDLNFMADSKSTNSNGATIYSLSTDDEGNELLIPRIDLPRGHSLTFWPNVTFKGRYYQSLSGEKRIVRGRYFGRILIDENTGSRTFRNKIKALNRERIFVYEWSIKKDDYIKKAFDVNPRTPNYANPNDSFAWDDVNPKRAWTKKASSVLFNNKDTFLEGEISDMEEFCPGFQEKSDEDKISFWVTLMNALSRKESRFDPLVSNYEGHFGSGTLDVTSRGLFQMSFKSLGSSRYRNNGCSIRTSDDLYYPAQNIECALAIFKTWIDSDKCISCKNEEDKHRGIARYWSPLRSRYQVPCSICRGGVANIGFKKEIQAETKAFCLK